MNRPAQQRQRVLRVRAIEHKAAALRVSKADATLVNLDRIARRLGELKEPLFAKFGAAHGQALNAMAEMGQRLDEAHASLARPIDEAKRNCAEVGAERAFAKMREDGVANLVARALRQEERDADLRADANRPKQHRKHRQRASVQ